MCPASAVTIWPVGDSLTSGFTTAGAYRSQLHRRLVAAGMEAEFVGSASNDASAYLTGVGETNHDGHSGWFIADTSASIDNNRGVFDKVPDWFSVIPEPDVILLMIGTNDINHNLGVPAAPSRFNTLLRRLVILAPDARIIAASIPPAEEDNRFKDPSMVGLDAAIRNYNAGVETMAARYDSVEFLDVYAAMDLSDLNSDGLHFSAAGYDKLGDLWADVLIVPEPGAGILLFLATAGSFLRRRRG